MLSRGGGTNRLLWVDFLRGLAMICVVFWHCGSIPSFNAVTGGFYLPMFFALSGYLFNRGSGLKLGRLFKRIYLPLLLFGVLPAIIGPIIRLDVYTLLKRSFFILTSWFLPTFFASTVIFRVLAVNVKDSFLSMLLSVFLMLIGFVLTKYEWAADYYTTNICLSTIFIGQCCIMLGYMWKKHEENHKVDLNAYKIVSFVSLCFFLAIEFITEPGSSIDFHTNSYPNIPIGMGIILSSLLFGYSWVRNIRFDIQWLKPLTFSVCFIGRYAIFVFLLHHYIIAFWSRILATIYPHIKQDPINAFVYTILTLLCCVIVIDILRRITPSLLGEKQSSK